MHRESEVTMSGEGTAIGPIDFVLLEFPGDADTKACADALMDLVERDTTPTCSTCW
jgi:hypothetical protein